MGRCSDVKNFYSSEICRNPLEQFSAKIAVLSRNSHCSWRDTLICLLQKYFDRNCDSQKSPLQSPKRSVTAMKNQLWVTHSFSSEGLKAGTKTCSRIRSKCRVQAQKHAAMSQITVYMTVQHPIPRQHLLNWYSLSHTIVCCFPRKASISEDC